MLDHMCNFDMFRTCIHTDHVYTLLNVQPQRTLCSAYCTQEQQNIEIECGKATECEWNWMDGWMGGMNGKPDITEMDSSEMCQRVSRVGEHKRVHS